MGDRTFYIVPNTKGYYEVICGASKEEALTKFAETMDTDVFAYFDAVEEKPISYPHGYKYPEGDFEVAIAIIMATMIKDKTSAYFIEGGLEGLNLEHMDEVGNLQCAYERLKTTDKHIALTSRKSFYKVLRDVTGFQFDKKKAWGPDENVRVVIGNSLSNKSIKKVNKLLDKKGISYTYSDNHILITGKDLKRVIKALRKVTPDIHYYVV